MEHEKKSLPNFVFRVGPAGLSVPRFVVVHCPDAWRRANFAHHGHWARFGVTPLPLPTLSPEHCPVNKAEKSNTREKNAQRVVIVGPGQLSSTRKGQYPDQIDLFQFKITRHQVRVSRFHFLPKTSHILYGKKGNHRTPSPATVRVMPLLTQLSLVNLHFRFVFGHFGRRLLQLRHFIPQPFHIRHFLGQFFGFHNVRRQLVLQSFASAAKLVPRRLNSLQRVTQRRNFSLALLEFLISRRPVTTQR